MVAACGPGGSRGTVVTSPALDGERWPRECRAVTFSDVPPQPVMWLWPGRIRTGKLVVLDGDPSTGKSTLTLDLAARVSTGADWPDGTRGGDPAGVLLLSAEDGVADTIVPRLTAAGACLSIVQALLEVPVPDHDGTRRTPPSLPRDIGVMAALIKKHRVRPVIVDVLMAYLLGGRQSPRSGWARRAASARLDGRRHRRHDSAGPAPK